mgnify:CR=1 FL=1
MKKIETTKRFVMSAHQAACQDWKRKIEEEFPSLFEVKLELNKWYKWKGLRPIIGFVDRVSRDKECYAFKYTISGDCGEDYNSLHYSNLELATPTEIESMLWKEAEKRGYAEGRKFNSLYDGRETTIRNGVYFYNCTEHGYCLIDNSETGGNYLFMDGKWAEICEDPNKEIKETISRLEKELSELKEKVK